MFTLHSVVFVLAGWLWHDMFLLSVPVQLVGWKDKALKWHLMSCGTSSNAYTPPWYTPAEAARPQIQGQCIAWYACLLTS